MELAIEKPSTKEVKASKTEDKRVITLSRENALSKLGITEDRQKAVIALDDRIQGIDKDAQSLAQDIKEWVTSSTANQQKVTDLADLRLTMAGGNKQDSKVKGIRLAVLRATSPDGSANKGEQTIEFVKSKTHVNGTKAVIKKKGKRSATVPKYSKAIAIKLFTTAIEYCLEQGKGELKEAMKKAFNSKGFIVSLRENNE